MLREKHNRLFEMARIRRISTNAAIRRHKSGWNQRAKKVITHHKLNLITEKCHRETIKKRFSVRKYRISFQFDLFELG